MVAIHRPAFSLYTSKKILHRCIILAATSSTHAQFNLTLPKCLPETAACIVAIFITMEHNALRSSTVFISHFKGVTAVTICHYIYFHTKQQIHPLKPNLKKSLVLVVFFVFPHKGSNTKNTSPQSVSPFVLFP